MRIVAIERFGLRVRRESEAPDLFGSAGVVALREQLGLSLAERRAPFDMLVIESVHEASDN